MTHLCRCCGKPLSLYMQESYIGGRPAFEVGTCKTPGCDLESVTRTVSDFNTFTDAEIASYARVNVQRRARMEVYAS